MGGLHGDKVAVDALLDHPDVAAVSFVGSTPVAKHIYETATAHGKRAQALGGAKNHALVLPDANLDVAADAIASAAFGSAGQRCMAISVAVPVGKETADRLRNRLIERVIEKKGLPMSIVTVAKAKLKLEFAGVDGKKGKTLTFEISTPDRCTLKDDPPDQIARKYIERWGFVVG